MRIIVHDVVGTIEVYMDCLRAICGETSGKSMIDLCCCTAPNTPKLGFAIRDYVDIIDRKLDHPEEQINFYKRNALDCAYHGLTYDVSLALDAIEHFHPEDGLKLIEVMKQISRKQVIFTPLGEIFQLHNTGMDDPEAHHSLWEPKDFLGWASIVFPNYHQQWNGGAFFSWRCEDVKEEFNRVYKELLTKGWMWNAKYEVA